MFRCACMRTVVPVLVMFLLSGAVFLSAGQQSAERTVLDGVYTEAQAERGTRAYMEHCSRCHDVDLRGNPVAPSLTGARFIDAWREDSLHSLFDHMTTRMPREPLTRLPTPVYVDILAFILQFNGYPPGQQELTEEQIPRVRFVDLSGAQPPSEPGTRPGGRVPDGWGKGRLDADEGDRAGSRQRREDHDARANSCSGRRAPGERVLRVAEPLGSA